VGTDADLAFLKIRVSCVDSLKTSSKEALNCDSALNCVPDDLNTEAGLFENLKLPKELT
jgi:hypothetical protein